MLRPNVTSSARSPAASTCHMLRTLLVRLFRQTDCSARQLLAQRCNRAQLSLDVFSSLAGTIGAELDELALEIRSGLVQQAVGVVALALLMTQNGDNVLCDREVDGQGRRCWNGERL